MGDIGKVIEQLKELVDEDNFYKQPETALKEIVKLENIYRVNTKDMLKGNYTEYILKEDVSKWVSLYQTYKNFGGEDKKLNINEN